MWQCQRTPVLLPSIARTYLFRWTHSNVVSKNLGIGNIRKEANIHSLPKKLTRLHRWDDMDEQNWLMIYRDFYASRFIVLTTLTLPVVGLLTSENFLDDIKAGRLKDAFCNTTTIKQMGIFAAFPALAFVLLALLALRLNFIRIHRIYFNKQDQKTFVAVVSRYCLFTQKVPFSRQNIRILESAGHRLWRFFKGSIKINRRTFALIDENFLDMRYLHLLAGRRTEFFRAVKESKF
ncbi:unnamed protein product [Thelazia callipaeda]|uniref:Transmembrane protein n=1 Tax=Thelazia callipaeda TaxID=103827 RepID=A0A0N5D8J3_THECL|nr:unnamed protein product [Thelazia callipaeda]